MTDKIDILINAQNRTGGAFAEVRRELSGLDQTAAQLKKGFSGLGAVIGAGAIVAGLVQIGNALDDVARRGAIFDQLGSVLNDFAASVGSTSSAFVEAGERASQGTISQFDLILNSNRAIQFEVAKTSEDFAKLIELSTALGRAQGISDTDALDFITRGIARQSSLILDNLGLFIDLDKVQREYAQSLGKTTGELTTAEKNQAILNEAFRQGAVAIEANRDAVDSAATQFERLDAKTKNLTDKLGALIAQNAAGFIKSLADAAEQAGNVIDGKGDLPNWFMELGADVQAMGAAMDGATPTTAALSAALQITGLAMQGLDESTRTGRSAFDDATDSFMELEGMAYNSGVALQMTSQDMDEVGRSAVLAAIDAGALTGELNKLAQMDAAAIVGAARGVVGIVGAQKAQEIAEQQLRYLQEQTLEMERQGVTGLELIFQNEEIKNQSLAIFENIEEADRAARRAAAGGVRDMQRAANDAKREFEELTGKVEGVLSGALSLDVGVDTEAILGREDAINEDARRLADVAVKGFESPWADYLKNKFPDLFADSFVPGNDIKRSAADALRAFEDGLVPELLDKDKAKARVRRMLLGEQSMAQLAQEIAAELSAEFGGSISLGKIQATASAALGVEGDGVQLAQTFGGVATDAAGQAATFGASFRNGIVSALDGIGEVVAIALDKQFKAENNLKIVSESGRVNGEAWSGGFLTAMDTLTSQVLEKLATLVGPYVEQIQARNATLNGAN
jgi:hypothetical protein